MSRVLLAALAAFSFASCTARQAGEPPPGSPPPRLAVDFQPLSEAELAKVKNPHDHAGKPLCQACHVPGDGRIAAPSAACTRCHRFGHHTHPVDVVVQAGPTPALPLLAGRRVACHTCHDPHGTRTALALRKQFDALCVECHKRH